MLLIHAMLICIDLVTRALGVKPRLLLDTSSLCQLKRPVIVNSGGSYKHVDILRRDRQRFRVP